MPRTVPPAGVRAGQEAFGRLPGRQRQIAQSKEEFGGKQGE
ncbi:MAG: hypothetical protein WKG07_26170 [Hymenobacter sp.]